MPVKASRQKPFFPPATTTVNWVAFTQWATSLALSIGEDDNDLLFTGLGSVLPPMPLLPSNSWRRIAGEDWALTAPRCAGVTLTKVMAAESDVFGLECELEAKQQSVGDLKELSMWMTIGNDPDQVYPYDPAFNLDGVEKLNWEYYSCMTAVSLGRIHQLEHELEDADQLLASLFE
ncbi:hypothetical protein IWQ60_006958 [Tieghemiomyces parasiticus]|uniref:Uncharacterized protein n=1 Tax=Tieghemiomyces parasiticus TaxID=78921 RepID=A0A9W8A779_9FUNG|nr:hypothetical protein IWQ60_006958 [Tieghemiomyces parasiticus]